MLLLGCLAVLVGVQLVWSTAIIPPYPGVSTGPPPSEVTLFYPGDTIPNSEEFPVGLSIDTSRAGALKMIVNMTLVHPNGTVEPLGQGRTDINLHAYHIAPWPTCTIPVGFDTDNNITLDDEVTTASWSTYNPALANGSYTLTWNLTYGTSPHPDQPYSRPNEDDLCGPGPYSYQSFFINQTFQVAGTRASFQSHHNLSGNGFGDFYNHTTTLPTMPTGLAWTGNITSKLHGNSARVRGCMMSSLTSFIWSALICGTIAALM